MLDPGPFAPLVWALLLAATGLPAGGGEIFSARIGEPAADRWMYPSNGTPGTRATASTFSALPSPASQTDADDRFAQFVVKFDTVAAGIPAGLGPENYDVPSLVFTAVIAQADGTEYDPTADPLASFGPAATPDPDPGRPLELHGTGFRGGFTAATFQENSNFGWGPPGSRNAHALGFDAQGNPRDVSHNVTAGFESAAWAIGSIAGRQAGETIQMYDEVRFQIDLSAPGVHDYVRQGLHAGFLWFTLSSLHSATQMGSSGFPGYFTRDHPEQDLFGDVAAALEIQYTLPLRVTAFTRAGNNTSLTWNAAPGFRYDVQTTADLADPDWQTVQSFTTAAPAPLVWTGTGTATRAFFRIARTPISPP